MIGIVAFLLSVISIGILLFGLVKGKSGKSYRYLLGGFSLATAISWTTHIVILEATLGSAILMCIWYFIAFGMLVPGDKLFPKEKK